MSKDKKYSPSIDQADELKCKYGLSFSEKKKEKNTSHFKEE